jgi:hypothetical protein
LICEEKAEHYPEQMDNNRRTGRKKSGETKTPASGSQKAVAGPNPSTPLPAVLSFLKDTRGVVSWSAKEMTECLGIGAREAAQILAVMEMQGYVKQAEDNEWLTTPAGEVLSGSRPPRFSADAVTKALSAIEERLSAVNKDKQARYTVSKAVAFGDFLSGRARVQAADVAVLLKPRKAGAESGSEEKSARQKFLKDLRGRTVAIQLREYEEWMTQRKYRKVME